MGNIKKEDAVRVSDLPVMDVEKYDHSAQKSKLSDTLEAFGISSSKTPSHYKMKIQPVDFIEENNLGFCAGNAIKYICRYDKKGTPKEDLDKAIHYLEMLKEKL